MDDYGLRYPIGEFDRNYAVGQAARAERIEAIRSLPQMLAEAVKGLTDDQLDTPYRPGGWTIRQTVHHIADSHSNSLNRFKLALTEDEVPTIKPYFEDRWAELGDYKLPIGVSLKWIDALHTRWAALLESMSEEDYRREFIHPETGSWPLEGALALYDWHSRHHLAHITSTVSRNGWNLNG